MTPTSVNASPMSVSGWPTNANVKLICGTCPTTTPKTAIDVAIERGDLRDAAGAARQRAARLREDAAEARDQAADEREAAGDWTGAAEDRRLSKVDREAAAIDRVWEGRDGDAAAADRALLAGQARSSER